MMVLSSPQCHCYGWNWSSRPFLCYVKTRMARDFMELCCLVALRLSNHLRTKVQAIDREIGIRRHNFRKDDLLIIPAGVAHWMCNNGDQDLLVVVMFDTTNNANQPDSIPKMLHQNQDKP